jgi:hypothetical protein
VGSYAVAPVRILGSPAISMAAPVVSADRTDPGVKQRLCSGDPWRVFGSPNDLIITLRTHSGGQTQLVALTKGRPSPLPLEFVADRALCRPDARGCSAELMRLVDWHSLLAGAERFGPGGHHHQGEGPSSPRR